MTGRNRAAQLAIVKQPRLFSQTFERSIRVMSQLATGKFKGVSSDDMGKNLLMNLILDRYVIPNANSQYDFLTKLRLIDWYSLAYGCMVALVDWIVTPNYIGPELFLIPIRNVYPQPGVSFHDMSWCQIVTDVDKSFIQAKKDQDGWQNIPEFLDLVQDSSGDSLADKPPDEMSLNDNEAGGLAQNSKKFPRFRLITEYRRDRWITYAPNQNLVLRDIPNPHENDKLPLVAKYCFPQIDSTFGLSEVEISSSMADVVNSLYNLAIEDAHMQLFPPMAIDPTSVAPWTIKFRPGERWMLNNRQARVPELLPTSNRGATSALEMRQMAIGSLQTLAGTSDTTVKQGEEASMGKTPQALKMQEARQSTRDEFDRFCMEQFISEVYSRFANLIVKKMPKEIALRLFETEIEQLTQYYPDIRELVEQTNHLSNTSGTKIPAKFFQNYIFDYEITPGSTYKIDQQTQASNLQFILEMAQNPTIKEALEASGKRLDIAETINRLLINSGIQDSDKILIDIPQETAQMPATPEASQLIGDQTQLSMPQPQPEEMPQQMPAAYPIPTQPENTQGPDPQIEAMRQAINQRAGVVS